MFSELFKFKSRFSHCMDGGIAESAASVIVESLDKGWLHVNEIETLSTKDSSFKKFILTNIEPNVTGQEAEVKRIVGKAKKSCPRKMNSFCRDLIQACENSLKSD